MTMVWSLWRDSNVWLNKQVLSKNKALKSYNAVCYSMLLALN